MFQDILSQKREARVPSFSFSLKIAFFQLILYYILLLLPLGLLNGLGKVFSDVDITGGFYEFFFIRKDFKTSALLFFFITHFAMIVAYLVTFRIILTRYSIKSGARYSHQEGGKVVDDKSLILFSLCCMGIDWVMEFSLEFFFARLNSYHSFGHFFLVYLLYFTLIPTFIYWSLKNHKFGLKWNGQSSSETREAKMICLMNRLSVISAEPSLGWCFRANLLHFFISFALVFILGCAFIAVIGFIATLFKNEPDVLLKQISFQDGGLITLLSDLQNHATSFWNEVTLKTIQFDFNQIPINKGVIVFIGVFALFFIFSILALDAYAWKIVFKPSRSGKGVLYPGFAQLFFFAASNFICVSLLDWIISVGLGKTSASIVGYSLIGIFLSFCFTSVFLYCCLERNFFDLVFCKRRLE